ncbi:YggT family protein [Pontiellaceae bacterium B12227]|nr:YggT family protein [Pontiellaceae bacterium B12227]
MFLFNLLDFAMGLFELGLFIYILCSWIMHPLAYKLLRWLAPAYEWMLAPIRRRIPAPRFGDTAIDLSPVFLLIALGLVRRLLFMLFF